MVEDREPSLTGQASEAAISLCYRDFLTVALFLKPSQISRSIGSTSVTPTEGWSHRERR